MGFIGCEVAASLTQLGVRVTAIFPGRVPLERVLGEEVGAAFAAIHRGNGVELRSQDQVVGVRGSRARGGGRDRQRRRVACDFAVVGIGIEPEIPTFAGAVGRAVQRRARRRALPRQRARRLRRRRRREPSASALRSRSRRALQQRRKAWGARRRGRCSARPPPTTTSTPSGPINTSTSSSTSATPRNGTSSSSAGACEERKLIGFYLLDGQLRAAVGLDRGGDPELDTTRRWRPAARLVARRAATCSRPARRRGVVDGPCGRLGVGEQRDVRPARRNQRAVEQRDDQLAQPHPV